MWQCSNKNLTIQTKSRMPTQVNKGVGKQNSPKAICSYMCLGTTGGATTHPGGRGGSDLCPLPTSFLDFLGATFLGGDWWWFLSDQKINSKLKHFRIYFAILPCKLNMSETEEIVICQVFMKFVGLVWSHLMVIVTFCCCCCWILALFTIAELAPL